ncbi:MAG: VanZ family protein [Candidatus Omnitrophica bacterium]|jgi:VanZ family protein|nr:VanZ family protein [Candidatus Omnitrophota bacterium]MDD5080316.1 VanZ family protein [Candidatus Omnitrophota bacterium]
MAASIKNNSWLRFVWLWLPVAACMYIIFYASSMSGKEVPELFHFQDILFHGIIYGNLALLFLRAVKNTCPRLVFARMLLVTLVFSGLYAVSDELHQLFVPGRECSVFDLFIDLTGSFLGSLIGGKIL